MIIPYIIKKKIMLYISFFQRTYKYVTVYVSSNLKRFTMYTVDIMLYIQHMFAHVRS